MKRCPCCICDCCYGSSEKAFCTLHETKNGKTEFNSPFSLILYDKWCKQNDLYQNRDRIFEQLLDVIIPNKDNRSQKRIILDLGCGTGAFTEILCKTFMSSNNDTLICLDSSPQCIHFLRTRVIERNKDLNNKYNFEYFNNDSNTLCLQSNYNKNDIDIIFMSFVMNHISTKNGDRHSILKEVYQYCKPGGTFIVFEYGTQFLDKFKDNKSGKNDEKENDQLLKNDQIDTIDTAQFPSCDALISYVEGFGFKLSAQIMKETFADKNWILSFNKPEI